MLRHLLLPIFKSTIRNITINNTDDTTGDCSSILCNLQKDELFVDDKLIKIKQKSPCSITYQCITHEIKVIQTYDIQQDNDSYKNIIIECDILTHKLILEKGFIIFGFKESRCVQYISLIQ